ncbi:MAG: DnaJ domain-containing protein [Candidatus Limnocylindrales bacterium]
MPQLTFHGDPYQVLGLPGDASNATIKRRWRELAREHHPDRANDPAEAALLTRQMARINAAYDLLRDPARRARVDGAAHPDQPDAHGPAFRPRQDDAPAGPPRPRPTRPVTARFDTTPVFHRRNATLRRTKIPLDGLRPVPTRERRASQEPLRSSDPCGPILRHRVPARPLRLPSLEEARATVLAFGKFHGRTLGDVERSEPTYIDWIARTITRDHGLVVRARVIRDDMDARGVRREVRTTTPGFGSSSPD